MRLLILITIAVMLSGCTRAFYRNQADCEVAGLVEQTSIGTEAVLPGFTIQPHPKSRMSAPGPADFPPMPPDDPVSNRYMKCVDGMRGWPYWDCYGKTRCIQNPFWLSYLPRQSDGSLVLDRQAAVQVALLESREYQNELEQLYLTALDVTFQRFRFDAQFFGGNDTYFTADGPDRNGDGRSSSRLDTDTGLEMRKLSATGGELVVSVANSLVWQFAGPDDYSGRTLLDFSFFQPLLRAGGRAVVLENLTESERALLANIRQMQRFRRAFYIQVVAGGAVVPGVSRGGVTLNSLSPGPTVTVGGMFALLSQEIRIHNRRANIAGLRDTLSRLEAFYEAGRVTRLQVDQSRQGLYSSQSQLLSLLVEHQDDLDAYKVRLGLPPDLDVRIQDKLLDQFNFVSPEMTSVREETAELLAEMRENLLTKNTAADFSSRVAAVAGDAQKQLAATRADYATLLKILPERSKRLEVLSQREEVRNGDVDPQSCSVAELQKRVALLRQDFIDGSAAEQPLEKRLTETLAQLGRYAGKPAPAGEELIDAVDLLSGELLELSLIQARARLDAAMITPVDLAPETALEIARSYRRDWKNARAALVNVWRQIEVTANDLESDLDVVFSGDITTKDNNPFRFRGTTGRLRVGLEFDAPLTRLVERNAYREALINYQRARRQYYTYEDEVNRSLRATLRAMDQDQLDFEIRRMAVQIAADQVNQAWLALSEPARPGADTDTNLGPTAARDLVTALSGLLDAQDAILGIWVRNEARRMILDLNLGTMRLDNCGMWIDPAERPLADPAELEDAGIEELNRRELQTEQGETMSLRLPNDWLFPEEGEKKEAEKIPTPQPEK